MIQILSLRPGSKGGKPIERWFERGLRAPSVEHIFQNSEEYISSLADDEKWNVYYTVSDCLEEPGRKLLEQHHIPFDIDGLQVPLDEKNNPLVPELSFIAKVACEAIGVDYEKCGVLFTGNGIQIIVGTTHTIKDPDFFDQARKHYGAICDRIDLRLIQNKIVGKSDRSVWSSARLMRYPKTWNRKPDKPERIGIILNSTIERVDYDITKRSLLPALAHSDHISSNALNAYPTPDTKTIMEECKFLKWCQMNPEKVSEPEWYAATSITARFENGDQFTHNMSKGHPGYSFEETELKIKQALSSSNPRTCKNIEAVSGGKCIGCKHHNTQLYTPIAITGEDYIKSEKHGFHNIFVDEETGKIKIGKPNYADLRKFFIRTHPYVSLKGIGTVRIWNGKYFDEYPRNSIKAFALQHFNPRSTEGIRNEFLSEIALRNEVPVEWFAESTEGKMNFQNGVYDIVKDEFMEHSMKFGFRSVLPCEFNRDAKAPRWEQFLREVTMDRQPLIDILQEFLGYTFANGECKHQKVLMLLGSGENGKSKFVDVIRALAGRNGFSSLSVKDMKNDQNRYIAEGKIVNIAEENSADSFRDTELVKNFARGGYISVKKVYEPPYEYPNKTKLIMLCNSLPRTFDMTHGFFRTFIMIPFDQVFSSAKGNKDPDILNKLLPELPGIFNWIMEGYRRLEKQNKFSESEDSNRLLDTYKVDSDSFLQWLGSEAQFSMDANKFTCRTSLYESYKKFCDDNHAYIESAQKFFDKLRTHIKNNGGIAVEKHSNVNGKRLRVINHIRLLDSPEF